MAYHPYRVQSLKDETRLLQHMLTLEDKVRVAREKDRRIKDNQNRRYSRMFQPITNSLKQLTNPTTTATTVEQPVPIKTEVIDDEHEEKDQKTEAKMIQDNPGVMYIKAFNSIPVRSRDDGVFGLNDRDRSIGEYSYKVDGDTLHIMDQENEVRAFVIDNYTLWQLLLIKRPKDIGLKLKDIRGNNTPALEEYIRIVKELDLVKIALRDGFQIMNRAKYKLLPKEGHGFLFTSTKPEFLIHPSVVVIPSDKKGLLRTLIKSVAEMRSGNTSMQNIVVPLAQEAKRLKILPPGLLTPEEMTWVFA